MKRAKLFCQVRDDEMRKNCANVNIIEVSMCVDVWIWCVTLGEYLKMLFRRFLCVDAILLRCLRFYSQPNISILLSFFQFFLHPPKNKNVFPLFPWTWIHVHENLLFYLDPVVFRFTIIQIHLLPLARAHEFPKSTWSGIVLLTFLGMWHPLPASQQILCTHRIIIFARFYHLSFSLYSIIVLNIIIIVANRCRRRRCCYCFSLLVPAARTPARRWI